MIHMLREHGSTHREETHPHGSEQVLAPVTGEHLGIFVTHRRSLFTQPLPHRLEQVIQV
jgi:hypothetical protein